MKSVRGLLGRIYFSTYRVSFFCHCETSSATDIAEGSKLKSTTMSFFHTVATDGMYNIVQALLVTVPATVYPAKFSKSEHPLPRQLVWVPKRQIQGAKTHDVPLSFATAFFCFFARPQWDALKFAKVALFDNFVICPRPVDTF